MTANQDPELQVSELLERWLEEIRDTLRPTSFAVYRSEVQNHILPVLGQLPLNRLTASTGEELGRILTDKGLSPRMVKDVSGKLSQALRWGVEQGYQVPILKETPPVREPQAVRTLTPEEQLRLEASLTGCPAALACAVVLTWKAGLTIGEVCALTWEDIDRTGGTMTVRRLCQRVQGGLTYLEEEPRRVPLPGELLNMTCGSLETGFLLHGARGGPAEPRLCQNWLSRHIQERGLPQDLTFAVLRNTCIRNLMERGTDFIQVSRLSGNRDLNDLWRKFGEFYSV